VPAAFWSTEWPGPRELERDASMMAVLGGDNASPFGAMLISRDDIDASSRQGTQLATGRPHLVIDDGAGGSIPRRRGGSRSTPASSASPSQLATKATG
jgi:hypothetical protein